MEKEIEDKIKKFLKEHKGEFVPSDIELKDVFKYKIYNEISLQLELGRYLEKELKNCKIFFEIPMYEKKSDEWDKKEVDIVIVNGNDKYAIELKFSQGKNGRVPENMYDFIKDIGFMDEVLDNKEDYKATFNLIIVNSDCYYENKRKNDGIYELFRNKDELSFIANIPIKKPTGEGDDTIELYHSHENLKWEEIFDNQYANYENYKNYRYLFIKHLKN